VQGNRNQLDNKQKVLKIYRRVNMSRKKITQEIAFINQEIKFMKEEMIVKSKTIWRYPLTSIGVQVYTQASNLHSLQRDLKLLTDYLGVEFVQTPSKVSNRVVQKIKKGKKK